MFLARIFKNQKGMSMMPILMLLGIMMVLFGSSFVLMNSRSESNSWVRERLALQNYVGKIKTILGNSDHCKAAVLPPTGSTLTISPTDGAQTSIRVEYFGKVWLPNNTNGTGFDFTNVLLTRTSDFSTFNLSGTDYNQALYKITYQADSDSKKAAGGRTASESDQIVLSILTNGSNELVECAVGPEFQNTSAGYTYSTEFTASQAGGGTATATAPATEAWEGCFLTRILGSYTGSGGFSYTQCKVDKPAASWVATAVEKQSFGMSCSAICLK